MASQISTEFAGIACFTRCVTPAGETSTPIECGGQTVVTASPGNGGTMLVEATWSMPSLVKSGAAIWFPWDQGSAGSVSAASSQILRKASAVRFTALGAAGIGEVAR